MRLSSDQCNNDGSNMYHSRPDSKGNPMGSCVLSFPIKGGKEGALTFCDRVRRRKGPKVLLGK